jgi:E2/UBC family protein E
METNPVHLLIFVNNKKFDEGISATMTVDAIARLVGLTAETAVVREQTGEKAGPPLTGSVEIHQGEHFVVTRKHVEGGYDGVRERIEKELQKLRDGGRKVTFVESPPSVIYHDLPCIADHSPIGTTDVMVRVPSGYAASPIDYACLPAGSLLIGRVKGSPQQVIAADGRSWQQISYHPHGNGGGPAWNPQQHGFHTYMDELLTWLANVR